MVKLINYPYVEMASRNELVTLLREAPLACDLSITLFQSAANSYKHDSLLRPFPPFFIDNGERDIDRLVREVPLPVFVLCENYECC